ncbi:MAG: endonuclease Q family protein [Candidatus Omnitrophota bacterium]
MFIADFHIHSKYSRATSKDMDIEHISEWARRKGIALMGTGDFTHPAWLNELKEALKEEGHGIFSHKNVFYILTAEVNNIFFRHGRTRRVHNIIFAPSFKAADEINSALARFGTLHADGRPVLNLQCGEMVKRLKDIDEDVFVVPAHVWTPHFGLFGAKTGFDSIEECFGNETRRIYALETGLSSDPAMNRRLSSLDGFCLISNSDAHSPAKIGREANVFSEKVGYRELIDILRGKNKNKFMFTVEFFPEEGKYHWDGHRKCAARLSPRETRDLGGMCPVCGGRVTVGVLNRVEKLSDRDCAVYPEGAPSFRRLVPLAEIIAETLDAGAGTLKVSREYMRLVSVFGSEFHLLLEAEENDIIEKCGPGIAQAVLNVRKGNVKISPGYDGEYGTVGIARTGETCGSSKQRSWAIG